MLTLVHVLALFLDLPGVKRPCKAGRLLASFLLETSGSLAGIAKRPTANRGVVFRLADQPQKMAFLYRQFSQLNRTCFLCSAMNLSAIFLRREYLLARVPFLIAKPGLGRASSYVASKSSGSPVYLGGVVQNRH
jgi:hypothetical protein